MFDYSIGNTLNISFLVVEYVSREVVPTKEIDYCIIRCRKIGQHFQGKL